MGPQHGNFTVHSAAQTVEGGLKLPVGFLLALEIGLHRGLHAGKAAFHADIARHDDRKTRRRQKDEQHKGGNNQMTKKTDASQIHARCSHKAPPKDGSRIGVSYRILEL
ncbi:hypothetical protein SDC9_185815 [bioreactor metagenome]|uniref:Uncharacterized protein n=1 Tax=bioreactor metagenome TaxID=1076179 RepID=A0A645HGZ1_9ZZZZ